MTDPIYLGSNWLLRKSKQLHRLWALKVILMYWNQCFFYFFLLGVGRSSVFGISMSAASASSASARILVSSAGVRVGKSEPMSLQKCRSFRYSFYSRPLLRNAALNGGYLENVIFQNYFNWIIIIVESQFLAP